MTDQVANTFGHVQWPSVVSTPAETYYQTEKKTRTTNQRTIKYTIAELVITHTDLGIHKVSILKDKLNHQNKNTGWQSTSHECNCRYTPTLVRSEACPKERDSF